MDTPHTHIDINTCQHTFSPNSPFLFTRDPHVPRTVRCSPVQLRLCTLPRVHGCHSLQISVTVVQQREHGWCLILAQDPKPCQQGTCRVESRLVIHIQVCPPSSTNMGDVSDHGACVGNRAAHTGGTTSEWGCVECTSSRLHTQYTVLIEMFCAPNVCENS